MTVHVPVLRSFECNVRGRQWQQTVTALSAGKAKAEYWRGVREAWPAIPFTAITCHVRGPATSGESFQRTAQYRGVPFAYVGMSVQVGEWRGLLVGANSSANFDVLFQDGPHAGQKLNCHPNWMMRYYTEDGSVLAEFNNRTEAEHG